MSPEIYTPFYEAICNVFAMMLDLSDIAQRPAEEFCCEDAMTVSVGVRGDLEGEVRYRFPTATSLNMVSIMSGMELETVDFFVTSAISEMANIISGNVVTLLAERDLYCDIQPPAIVDTAPQGFFYLRSERCLDTPAGVVALEIRLNPSDNVFI